MSLNVHSSDLTSCEEEEWPLFRESCYYKIAEEKNDVDICALSNETRVREGCYMRFASATVEPKICELILTQKNKDECYLNIMRHTEDINWCNKIQTAQYKSLCLSDYGRVKERVQLENLMAYSLIYWIIFYIYLAFVLMTLSKKLKRGSPWFAWVPLLNIYLMVEVAALPIGIFLIILFAGFIPKIGWIISLSFAIFVWWKIAEARNKPCWYGLLAAVPIINLLVIGIIAWKDD